MNRAFFAVLAAVSVVSLSYGVPLTASWVEGDVFVRAGSSWKEIQPGDRVESSAAVRLGLNSFAEFSSGGRKIALSAEGTFNLDALLSASASRVQRSSSVLSKMERLVVDRSPRSTTAAGVRSEMQGDPEKTEWALDDEDPQTLAEDAQGLVKEMRYAEAAKKFGAAAEGAMGGQRDEYRYSQAWCLAASSDSIGAIKILRPMNAEGAFAVPRALLLARLNLDTGAAREALAVLDQIVRVRSLSADEAGLADELRDEARRAISGN